eukprot:2333748-Alexandrium_andersonii.AAC.1
MARRSMSSGYWANEQEGGRDGPSGVAPSGVEARAGPEIGPRRGAFSGDALGSGWVGFRVGCRGTATRWCSFVANGVMLGWG